ncbi:TonB-dependent receptor domain-containing protein [Altericroceibacterium endophyticum]|uniref:TonB-dependent receptor domain-containing protein n=1 Tax=Altericroceibacterium endophyticum TaxID=1808508 RepID=UPI001369FF62
MAAQPALAQDRATSDEGAQRSEAGGIAEIVVTATRKATNLQDTPIAITAVTSDTLETRALQDVSGLGSIVPNASFRQAQGAFGKAVTAFIRGIGQYDSNLAAEPGVAFYIDDVYYPLLYGSQFDLLDLERVEVLRGPQGTLFGRNALAGAVNIISKSPDFDESSGYTTVTLGRYNRTDLRAGFNVPLTDNLAFRANGLVKKRNGYQDRLDFRCDMIRQGTPELAGNFPFSDGVLIQSDKLSRDDCKVGTLGGEDVVAVRGAARWEPVSGLNLTVSADYTRDESENAADTLIDVNDAVGTSRANINAVGDYFSIPGEIPFRYDSRFVPDDPYVSYATNADPIGAGLNLPGSTFYNGDPLRGGYKYPLVGPVTNWGVSGKLTYDLDNATQIMLVGGYRSVDSIFGFDVDGSPILLEQTRNNTGSTHWTGELRFTGSRDLIDWTMGAFYYTGDGYVRTTLSSPWNNLQRYQDHTYDPESKAVYANFVVRPIDRLSVTLGGRYSDDKKRVNYENLQDGNPAGDIVFQITPGDKRFDWKLGLDYQLTDNFMVYSSAATGFSLPSFNSRPFQPSQVTQIPGDETLAYELGFKSDLFDRRLRLNITGFYTDYKTRPGSVGGQEYLLDASGNPIPVSGGGSVTVPLPAGGPDATTCRVLTPAEISAGTTGYECVSRTYYVNYPGKIKGVEGELQAEPIDGLLIDGSFGYANFRSDDLDNTTNKRPTRVPEWTASGGIQYEIDAPALAGTITPRLDWFYQGSIVYETNNDRYNQPGYSVFNGRLTYDNPDRGLQVALGATNLFNKFYYRNLFVLQAFGFPQANGQPAPPREWYLSVSKKF